MTAITSSGRAVRAILLKVPTTHWSGWHKKKQFPPILLLRRYLKLAIEIGGERKLMDTPFAEIPELPFSLPAIPQSFPAPGQLRLWVVGIS